MKQKADLEIDAMLPSTTDAVDYKMFRRMWCLASFKCSFGECFIWFLVTTLRAVPLSMDFVCSADRLQTPR